jgi:ABC-2 type transport system permease protein
VNAALYRKELKRYRVSFAVWAVSIVGLSFLTMAAMPTMLANADALGAYISAFPEGFLKAFSFDMSSFADPLGFYVVYSTIYVALLGGAFSMYVGAGIISREEAQGSADFLLAKPLSRVKIVLTKEAAWLTYVILLNVLTFLDGWAALALFSPRPWSMASYVVISLYSLLLSASLGAIGLLVSLLPRRARSFTGPGIGIVLGLYLLDAVTKISERYDAWGWISPFKWIDLKVSVPGYALAGWRVALFAALTLACAGGALLYYRRKDILT